LEIRFRKRQVSFLVVKTVSFCSLKIKIKFPTHNEHCTNWYQISQSMFHDCNAIKRTLNVTQYVMEMHTFYLL